MKTTFTTLLLLACSLANAAPGSWSVVPLHEGPGVAGRQNVLQTSLAGPQLVISLEVTGSEPHAEGRWLLLFSTRQPVTGFQKVTATANNSNGPTYVWPIEVLNETAIIGNDDGSTTIVIEVSFDGIRTIQAADQVLFSHSDDKIETVLLRENFDEQFDVLEAGIHSNEQGLELRHLTVDDYDRNHLPLGKVPKGSWPPAGEIDRARTYLGLTATEIEAMSWHDIETMVFDKESAEFDKQQAEFAAEQEELRRRNMHMKLSVESFAFPDPGTCAEPAVPSSFATTEEAEEKTAEINHFAACLRASARADFDAFGQLVTAAGGTLDPNTLEFDVEGAYFTDCECVEAFVVIRDKFYQRSAGTFQRWETFEQSVAHLYLKPGQ